jgi:hypothetical protein
MKLFFGATLEWTNMMDFVDDVDVFEELVAGALRDEAIRTIFERYLVANSGSCVHTAISKLEDFGVGITASTITPDILFQIAAHIMNELSGAPFANFLQSRHFHRYLQWKVQPVIFTVRF